jgi:hypothetical protein
VEDGEFVAACERRVNQMWAKKNCAAEYQDAHS